MTGAQSAREVILERKEAVGRLLAQRQLVVDGGVSLVFENRNGQLMNSSEKNR